MNGHLEKRIGIISDFFMAGSSINKVKRIGAAQWLLRLTLAAGFLSAVADRFGLWGTPGAPNVAWGEWQAFVEYVALLNWFAPESVIPVLAWAATVAELLVALGLLSGWQVRRVAMAGGLLLLAFAVTMTMALGIKAALDFSVFGVAAGAFLLAAISEERVGKPEHEALQVPVGV